MGYLTVQQHLSACTKHLAGLQLARHKARRLSNLHTFNSKCTVYFFANCYLTMSNIGAQWSYPFGQSYVGVYCSDSTEKLFKVIIKKVH